MTCGSDMAENIDTEVLEKITDKIIDNFKKNESKINDMNVFPVPDGDTGTNMLLTLQSIKEEILKTQDPTLKAVLEKASMGALMGARGNSGVILSQILRGFSLVGVLIFHAPSVCVYLDTSLRCI